MNPTHRRLLAGGTAFVAAALVAGAATQPATAAGEERSRHGGVADRWSGVEAAAKVTGRSVPNVLSPQLSEHVVAQGSTPLDGGSAQMPYYGYNGDGPMLPAPGAVPAPGHVIEASKTEPDKNVYLRLRGQSGADPRARYGTHFLFQGHEGGAGGYLTRINLDADPAHRVTLMAGSYADGSPMPTFDGITWDPFAQRLLLTAESRTHGGVSQATLGYPSKVEDLGAVLGRGGYEGVQNDAAGNVWLVEDVGGSTVPDSGGAKLPNSFVYRFVPVDRTDLAKGGVLQALQVLSNTTGAPITYQPIDAAHPSGNAFSADEKALHTYGTSFATRWVTVHDTATDTSGAAFSATDAAKAAGATPFKRPENGVFRPGTGFAEFYFSETGDTNANSAANDGYGGWGTIFRLRLDRSGATGRLSAVYTGDRDHAGFDNVTFVDARHLAVVEDAGDTLHSQRGKLDSGYLVDVTHDYADGTVPVRFLAEGRDPSATLDSAFGAYPGFNNDGDNEITGIHVSNGDPTARGLLGAAVPRLFDDGWRLFWTQQHGDNQTWEITAAGAE